MLEYVGCLSQMFSGKQPCPELRPPSSYERMKVSQFLPNLNQAFHQRLHDTMAIGHFGLIIYLIHHLLSKTTQFNRLDMHKELRWIGGSSDTIWPPRVFCPRSAPLAEKVPHRIGWPGVAWGHPTSTSRNVEIGMCPTKYASGFGEGPNEPSKSYLMWSDCIAVFIVKTKQFFLDT